MVPSQSGNEKDADLEAIRSQLEYYFSDSNLPRDKFLRAKTEENEKGYVPIPVLLTFKRLQNLGADVKNIIQAVKGSKLIGLDKAHTSVRRLTPLPEVDLFPQRSVFVKGWKPGGPEPSLEELRELFTASGNVLSVRFRRWKDDDGRHFKGSVFIEMESAEAVERVVADEYTIQVKDDDGKEVEKTLLVLPIDEYFVAKRKEKEDYNRRKQKERSERKKNKLKNEQQASDDVEKKATRKESDRKVTPGLILKFEGFGPDVSREDIREAFEPHGDVAWVDFRKGDSEGYIRFANEGAAKISCEAMAESKLEFGGKIPTFTVLEGEAEQLYWKNMWEQKDANIQNSRKRRREQGRGGGRSFKRFRGSGRRRQ
ncbi:Lupus La protein [Gracilariopsis chorda]|uniref:Lupus La protein n=1 Tax=Gracilariopsis chorda TaxID=448386 RepID=A0A2V3J1G8_9FLOR|nr:Lupus La protein [Gracilariopsis chorda]|eukprot:PXF48189.1 Lupus La protein [Gracilariopsis chorda]